MEDLRIIHNFLNLLFVTSCKSQAMNTLELKDILISEIAKIDDESFLSALKTILDSRKSIPKN